MNNMNKPELSLSDLVVKCDDDKDNEQKFSRQLVFKPNDQITSAPNKSNTVIAKPTKTKNPKAHDAKLGRGVAKVFDDKPINNTGRGIVKGQ